MISVYKIKFTKDPSKLNEEYDKLSDIDKEKISDMNADSFFAFEEDDKYAFFVLTDPIELGSYLNVLNENFIRFELKDLSSDILKGIYNIESLNADLYKDKKYSLFVEDLNKWIYNNLDIDTILDRISTFGIESLRKVEKKFLDNYKP